MRFKPRSRPSRSRLGRDRESGQALVLFVLCLPVLIGFAALVIDVGNLYAQKRFVQNAADAAVLAAAQDLPDSGAAQAQAQSYVTRNGGGTAVVSFPQDGKIRVRVTRSVSTYFAKLFGLSSVNVAAQASASRFANGPGALAFARSTACDAIKIVGSNSTFKGAVISDGGADVKETNGGEHLIWNPATGVGCLNLHGGTGWARVEALPPRDWPVPMPTLSPAPPAKPTSVNGVPCVNQPVPDTLNVTTVLAPGIYCANSQIKINCPGCVINNVAFVAPSIFWSSRDGRITANQSIYPQYGGLLFYAYGAGGMNMSGAGNSWSGGIFVPNAVAHLNGGNGTVLTGYVEANTIEIPGSNITWIGTGPSVGGSGGVSLTE
jgi:Flp pilus assembly protein TadG